MKLKTKSKDRVMGRFAVDVELANNADIELAHSGHLAPDKIRRVKLKGVVDNGAAHVVLPEAVAKQLGLRVTGKVKVRYADKRTALRPQVEGVHLELLGRNSVFRATLEPKRDTALIGAIVLEDLDLLVDCTHQRLYPRDPKFIISEVE